MDEKVEIDAPEKLKIQEQLKLPIEPEKFICDFCDEPSEQSNVYSLDKEFLSFIDIYYRGNKLEQAYLSDPELLICQDCLENRAPSEDKEYCISCGKWEDKDESRYIGNDTAIKLFECGRCVGDTDFVKKNIEKFNSIFPEHKSENYSICEGCEGAEFLMCAECEDVILQECDEYETFRKRNERYDSYYHETCFQKNHSMCSGCGENFYYEDIYTCEKNNKTYCESCYFTECNTENENDFERLNQKLDEINYTPRTISTIPIKVNVIKKIENELKSILSKNKINAEWIYSSAVDSLYEKIKKQDIQETDKLEILNNLFTEQTTEKRYLIKAYAERLLEKILQANNVSDGLSTIFPGVSSQLKNKFFPLNVGYTIVKPHSEDYPDSFVLTMWPTKEMENECLNRFKQESSAEIMFEKFFSGGHHDGALAYARVSVQSDTWILNNLQRDADIYRHQDGREINPNYKEIFTYLEKQIKDTWAPQMLIQLKLLAKNAGAKLYMTPFDVQKDKWSTIPDRNKDVYNEVPKQMGISQERLEGKNIEGIGVGTRDMWRVASRMNRMIKLSRLR
jgi:hypothetical protein